MFQRLILLMIVCCTMAAAADAVAERWREVAGVRVPVVKTPVYVMEYHLWYDAPVGPEARPGWFHGGDSEVVETDSMGPDWMRMRFGVGWPLPGAYESGDPGIIRWQLRCLKATGVDGVFVQLFSDWGHPERFHRIAEFETLLRIAEEEGIQVGIHDEVQFRNPKAKDPQVMAVRAGAVLKAYGGSKAYLRIDGKPAYAFQWWGQLQSGDFKGMTHEELRGMFQEADRIAGTPTFWMPFRHASDRALLSIPETGGAVVMSNCNNQFRTVATDPAKRGNRFEGLPGYTDVPPGAVMIPDEVAAVQAARRDFPGKRIGLWVYPGFNNTTQRAANDHVEWLPRRGGRTLAEGMAAFAGYGCDFIMLSSWNDWEENTAIEPGFMYDGYAGDPYLYCRIVAAAKDREFVPPPLPPKESVDPLMWQRLFGIDRTPPRMTRVRYLPLEPALVAEFADSGSAVARAAVLAHGDLWATSSGAGTGLTLRGGTPVVDGAWEVPAKQQLEFAIDRTALVGCTELWVAVEFADRASGSLRISYPAAVERADDRPSDERKVAMEASIRLGGTGIWQAQTRLLRAVDAAKDAPLRIRVGGESGTVRIAGVHLFRLAGGRGVEGLELSGAADASQVKTFRLPTPGLQSAPVPGTVFLVATDAAGNRTHPIPVSGARFGQNLGNQP